MNKPEVTSSEAAPRIQVPCSLRSPSRIVAICAYRATARAMDAEPEQPEEPSGMTPCEWALTFFVAGVECILTLYRWLTTGGN